MTPVGVQRRRAGLRIVGRRRAASTDGTPRLFGESCVSVLETPADEEEVPVCVAGSDPSGRGERATLEELVGHLWEEVLAEGRAVCPLCGGEMVGRASAHARPTEGLCRECGTTIA